MTTENMKDLESESIEIIREAYANSNNPVMLYSLGKDSSVLLHLAKKAFAPSKLPFPLLHVDTKWKFREMYEFKEKVATETEVITYINPDGDELGINPFISGSDLHTDVMKTQALKKALNIYGYDGILAGARRDEEKSRAKERVFSFRNSDHAWNPKNQRPEIWKIYNTDIKSGESMRIFPLSNWTEVDVWHYIYMENIDLVPLYFAKPRQVVERSGQLIIADDERIPLRKGEKIRTLKVRFRTLGCWPLTAAIESDADTIEKVVQEVIASRHSEREGRLIDSDSIGSMERRKREGYF
jgi:sulfate adenylyltransferase subunit 2